MNISIKGEMMISRTLLVLFLVSGVFGPAYAVSTHLGDFKSLGSTIELRYDRSISHYTLFFADKHNVNTCLVQTKSAGLTQFRNAFKRAVDQLTSLSPGDSKKMPPFQLGDATIHLVSHYEKDSTGQWVQIMVSRGADRISYGIFSTTQATELYQLLDTRYGR